MVTPESPRSAYAGVHSGETLAWLGFSLTPSVGNKRMELLLSAFGSARAAWQAAEGDLRDSGIGPAAAAQVVRSRQTLDLELQLKRIARAGARVITPLDEEYPGLLRALPDRPLALYIRGELRPEDALSVAVVGTRRATSYGRDAALHLSRDLARNRVTIVSGLAHGIDAAAHRAAIEAGGRTIAVMGCGIDRVYPSDHRTLAEQVAAHGAVITEFPLGTPPDAHNFPRRNRVISGMSLGVLIVEAPEQSGAIITATAASEQGRDVFAVPGNIFKPASAGANRLIQDGAKLVISVEDILSELNLAQAAETTRVTAEKIAPASAEEAAVLNLLSADPLHVDDIARQTGLPVQIVTGTLTLLELKGLARLTGSMQYCLPL